MKRNLIFKLLILICIFTLINSCRLFLRSRIVLNLNKESKGNKEYIISILEEYTDNTEKISKVAYGREWTHGFIYVYRSFDKTEALLISEGEFEKGGLADYIQKNGYNEKSIGIWYGGVSIIVIISCIIKLKFAKKWNFSKY